MTSSHQQRLAELRRQVRAVLATETLIGPTYESHEDQIMKIIDKALFEERVWAAGNREHLEDFLIRAKKRAGRCHESA